METNWVLKSVMEGIKEVEKHDPFGYVSKNEKKLRKIYEGQIIVVSGTGVLGNGPDLDNILNGIDLKSADEKVIAGTIDSILRKKFVWIKNEDADTPNDANRNAYFAAKNAEFKIRNVIGTFSPRARKGIIAAARYAASNEAIKTDKQARSNVYRTGRGYTSANFR